MTDRVFSAIQMFVMGLAIGAAVLAGHALLLYTGGGFLRTAGFLLALTLLSLSAGLWAGSASPPTPRRLRWRRTWAMAAFALAGMFAAVWGVNAPLRGSSLGGALAVLIVLAEPAYTSGSLLATMRPRPGGQAAMALAGAAAGILITAAFLIPRLDASTIYLGAATAVFLATMLNPLSPPGGEGMKERVVLVTGVSSRGQVGYALAQRFLEAGACVIVSARGNDVIAHATELTAFGEVLGVPADLTEDAEVDRLFETVREKFGRLDAVINVAGGLTVIKPLAETSPEEWRREIERNAETALRVSRAALPLLRESRGSIVNFASPAGERAVKSLGAYSAAKAAVIALTRAMALEEKANGVRVNAIAPGIINTTANRESATNPAEAKFVTREEIAEATLFLASERASGVSGEILHVMGETLK